VLERIRSGVPAQITADGIATGIDPDRISSPVRSPPPRVPSRYRLTSRRRRGDAHRVVASALAVLALVGCVTAVLVLAVAPTAARMQADIASLNARLAMTQGQLAALRSAAARDATRGLHLARNVGLLNRHIAGLQRTVSELEGSSTLTREQAAGLRVCFARLQQELTGLRLRTRSTHGHVTTVGLSVRVAPSAACGAAFGAV
jgi:hypothetical protein